MTWISLLSQVQYSQCFKISWKPQVAKLLPLLHPALVHFCVYRNGVI